MESGEPDFPRLPMLRIAPFWFTKFTSTVSISIFTSRLVSRPAMPQLSPCLRASPTTSGGSSARRTIHDHAKRNISRFLRDPRFEPCLHPSGTIPVKQLRDGTFAAAALRLHTASSIPSVAMPSHAINVLPPRLLPPLHAPRSPNVDGHIPYIPVFVSLLITTQLNCKPDQLHEAAGLAMCPALAMPEIPFTLRPLLSSFRVCTPLACRRIPEIIVTGRRFCGLRRLHYPIPVGLVDLQAPTRGRSRPLCHSEPIRSGRLDLAHTHPKLHLHST